MVCDLWLVGLDLFWLTAAKNTIVKVAFEL